MPHCGAKQRKMKLIVWKDQESILVDDNGERYPLVYIPVYQDGDDEAIVSYVLPWQDPANDTTIEDVVEIEWR